MIKNGEMVFLYNEKSTFMLPFQPNQTLSSHKGNITLPEGLQYGATLESTKGFLFHVLKPTLADLMTKVRRCGSIIYPKDAAVIITELGIQNGSKVIEIGTGSGSLTVLLASITGPEGKIHTFERREKHQKTAKSNMERYGLSDRVEFYLKDPAEEDQGFGIENADALFLDLPEPWQMIPHAHRALAKHGRIGSLSPNIEQIQATADAMRKTGFTRLRCVEILERGYRIKKNLTRPFDRMIGHSGYLLFASKISEPEEIEEVHQKKNRTLEIPDIQQNNGEL